MTNTTRTALSLLPAWLRALRVDAQVYGRPDILALVELARCGNATALRACERHSAAIRA